MLYRVAQGLAWSLLGLSLSGCLRDVVTLSPEGENIKLVRQGDKPIDCDVVATVSGTGTDLILDLSGYFK